LSKKGNYPFIRWFQEVPSGQYFLGQQIWITDGSIPHGQELPAVPAVSPRWRCASRRAGEKIQRAIEEGQGGDNEPWTQSRQRCKKSINFLSIATPSHKTLAGGPTRMQNIPWKVRYMTKHRMTPFFALTASPNLKVGASIDLQTHLAELLALEAIAGEVSDHKDTKTTWTTSIAKQAVGGALSFAAFRGKISPNPETGHAEPQVSAERNLSLDQYRDLGLFDELGRADTDWLHDDIALGVNFSRLHRIALMIENRAADFMQTMKARIDEDMRSTAKYAEMESAAERRCSRQEKERQRRHEEWLVECAQQERETKERRDREQAEALEVKRRLAACVGVTFENDFDLECKVETAVNKTSKGYENTFNKPMPEPWAQNGPFTWVRISGVQGRIFFDASGTRIPEPS